ncbi:MAG: hypothetical protein R3C24_08470 [Cyanobacteriota/Melainabacteria group bacterium]
MQSSTAGGARRRRDASLAHKIYGVEIPGLKPLLALRKAKIDIQGLPGAIRRQ